MFISHKSNVLQTVHETEWQCRRLVKGLSKSEYWTWLDSVTTVTGTAPDEVSTVDLSGETGYTIVECTDEDVQARLIQLSEYVNQNRAPGEALVYNIKWSKNKVNCEEVLDIDGKSQSPKVYVKSHFKGDNTAKDARLLADEWTRIRAERDRLLAETDWTQNNDSPCTAIDKSQWKTYRQELRDIPKEQSSAKKYTDITWPSSENI